MASEFEHVPTFDPELADLFSAVKSAVGIDGLNEILAAHKRHNHGGYPKSLQDEYDPYFFLRNTFRILPHHLEVGRAVGLEKPEQIQLVTHILNALDDLVGRPNYALTAATKVLEALADQAQTISKDDLDSLQKLVTNVSENGLIGACLYVTSLGVKLGIDVPKAVHLAFQIPDSDQSMAAYTLPHFFSALKTLIYTGVGPEQVYSLFHELGDQSPAERERAYSVLRTALVFVCHNHQILPKQLIDAIQQAYVEPQNLADFVISYFDEKHEIGKIEATIILGKPGGQFYPLTEGRLEIAAQPYRLSRSFVEGLGDLVRHIFNSQYAWDEVSEGYWVFSPKTSEWFSLGGETEVRMNSVHHDIPPYDISQFGSEQYHAHIHPAELEFSVAPTWFEPEEEALTTLVTKFFSATPSRADFQRMAEFLKRTTPVKSRSLIVHSIGMTEFTYPHDVEQLEALASTYQDIRDTVLAEIDWNSFKQNYKPSELQAQIKNWIDKLSSLLPADFSISYHSSITE